MTWSGRPPWPAGHRVKASEAKAVLDQIELCQSFGNVEGIKNAGASDTTTSSTYANLAGTSSFSFTKRYDDTRLLVSMTLDCHAVSSSAVVRYGINVNSTDHDIGQHTFDSTDEREAITFDAIIAAASVPAGTYTVQGIWKRVSGTGTLTRDSSSYLSIMVREIDE